MAMNLIFPSNQGSGRFFLNDGTVQTLQWSLSPHCSFTFDMEGSGRSFELSDAEERAGFLCYISDDGTIFTPVVHLDDGEPDPVGVPSADDLKNASGPAVVAMSKAVMDEKLEASDMEFGMQLMTKPACFLRVWQKHQDITKGQMAIVDWLVQRWGSVKLY